MVLPPGHAHFTTVEYESAAGRVRALHPSKVLKWILPGPCEHMFVSVSPTIPIINFYGRVKSKTQHIVVENFPYHYI